MRYFIGILLALVVWPLSTRASDPVGAEACGTCHVQEYNMWKSSPHAMALARLSGAQQRNRGCRSCHTLAPQLDLPQFSGVQCESCHGNGEHYSPTNVMRDKKLATLMGLEKVTAKTCEKCHNETTPGLTKFDFAEKKKLIKHWADKIPVPNKSKK